MKKKWKSIKGLLVILLIMFPYILFAGESTVKTATASSVASNEFVSYLVGGIIALFIMVYLIYSLLRPEKF